jgi:hypothetical protein
MKSRVKKILREQYGVRQINGKSLSSYKFSFLCAYIDMLNKN